MKTYFGAFVLAVIITAVLTPVIKLVAPKTGAIDLPSGRRVNRKVIPRLGGVAIIVGFFSPVIALIFYDNSVSVTLYDSIYLMIGFTIGGLCVATIGLVDDMKGVRALIKLVVQIIAGVIAFYFGFRIESVDLPFLPPMEMGVFALPVTVLWIVGVVNAMNLIDGLDGLAAGVALFASILNFTISMIVGNIFVSLLSASMSGALLGFLFYNFNPATIFMGDVGSMFLGYFLGCVSLVSTAGKASATVSIAVPLLALGVPIMDTLFAIVRRFLERRSLFSPDSGHIHHRLLQLGLTQKRAVLILYALTALYTALAIIVYMGRSWEIGIALFIASVTVIGLIRSIGFFDYIRNKRFLREGKRPAWVENLRSKVPETLNEIASAQNHEVATQAIKKFAEKAGFLTVVCDCNGRNPPGSWIWENAQSKNGNGNNNNQDGIFKPRGYISVKYPVLVCNEEIGNIKFGWISDQKEIPPQGDILLQLVVDAYNSKVSSLQ